MRAYEGSTQIQQFVTPEIRFCAVARTRLTLAGLCPRSTSARSSSWRSGDVPKSHHMFDHHLPIARRVSIRGASSVVTRQLGPIRGPISETLPWPKMAGSQTDQLETMMRPAKPTVGSVYRDREGMIYVAREVTDSPDIASTEYKVLLISGYQAQQEITPEPMHEVEFENLCTEKGLARWAAPQE